MSALALRLFERTAFEPEARANSRPDLELVAGEMRERVGRRLEATRRYEPFAQALNPAAPGSLATPETEAHRLDVRLQDAVSSAFPLPRQPTPLSLQPLQEWEGYVAEVGDEVFTARLLDITAGGKYEDEVADFPIADLSATDLELLKPGAVFRWVIGYQRQLGGTKRRVSQITFRRLPAWTKRDLREAALKAEQLSQAIDWQ